MVSSTYQKHAILTFIVFGVGLGLSFGTQEPVPEARVASLSPQVSDLIIESGLASVLVASVKRYSGPAHPTIELGTFLQPSAERLFLLNPDWVVTDEGVPPSAAKSRWEAFGIKTLTLRLREAQDLAESATILYREIKGQKEVPAIAVRATRCLEKVKTQNGMKDEALLFVSLSPPILAAKGSFLSSLLSHAGYKNLADPKWGNAYPLVTEEWLVARTPKAIFYLDHGFGEAEDVVAKIKKWWPRSPPAFWPLASEPFARASFATLKKWEAFRRSTPKECHEVL